MEQSHLFSEWKEGYIASRSQKYCCWKHALHWILESVGLWPMYAFVWVYLTVRYMMYENATTMWLSNKGRNSGSPWEVKLSFSLPVLQTFEKHLWSLPICSILCYLCAPLGTSFLVVSQWKKNIPLLLVQNILCSLPQNFYFLLQTLPVEKRDWFSQKSMTFL